MVRDREVGLVADTPAAKAIETETVEEALGLPLVADTPADKAIETVCFRVVELYSRRRHPSR